MSKPSSLADLGVCVPHPITAPRTTTHARFTDIKTYLAGSMPSVNVGDIYEDMDPRCAGRLVQVLNVSTDARVMVRTIAPRTCPPRTPSKTPKATVGAVTFIALRRFRENSRGFRRVATTPLREVQSYLLACRLSDACDLSVTDLEIRTADALIALLGSTQANDYIAALGSDASDVYLKGGLTALIDDALEYADGIDDWTSITISDRASARFVAQHI